MFEWFPEKRAKNRGFPDSGMAAMLSRIAPDQLDRTVGRDFDRDVSKDARYIERNLHRGPLGCVD